MKTARSFFFRSPSTTCSFTSEKPAKTFKLPASTFFLRPLPCSHPHHAYFPLVLPFAFLSFPPPLPHFQAIHPYLLSLKIGSHAA